MISRTTRMLVLAFAITMCWSSVSLAVSEATMLFLQLNPGARAAGMGEAFVAISDDATATHYNPAGLGKFPLAAGWLVNDIPFNLRPIASFAAIKKGSRSSYLGYEIWAITADGLRRYDYRDWHSSEVFSVPSTQTLKQFVTRYFRVDDEEEMERLTKRVAEANNDQTFEWLGNLKDTLLSIVPEDYSARQSLVDGLDSLMEGYYTCRLDWNYISALQEHIQDGFEDSVFSERELDRINVAVERAFMRYIREEIEIPLNALFSSTPTMIESNGDVLLVGSADGLYRYQNSSWRRLTLEDGLPSENITALQSNPGFILIGTDNGVVTYTGSLLKQLSAETELPIGEIKAISASSTKDIYAVVNQDLYHYDGKTWSNWHDYTVVLDDDLNRIGKKFSFYGTTAEREQYRAKLAGIDQNRSAPIKLELDSVGMAAVKSAAVEDGGMDDSLAQDSVMVETEASAQDSAVVETEAEDQFQPLDDELLPGSVIRVPYLASIKGEVNDIHVSSGGRVWIGTEYGVMRLDQTGSQLVGWKTITIDSTQTLQSMIALRAAKDRVFSSADSLIQQAYLEDIKLINDLGGESLSVGQELKVYAYPTAYPIKMIEQSNDGLYFGTDQGLLTYADGAWSRAGFKGMGEANIDDLYVHSDEIWVLSDEHLVARRKGRTEYTFMHAKWLPALTAGMDDMYYEYVGFVTSHESIGTFGGNVTYANWGDMEGTDEFGNSLGTFQSFEIALTLSYGTSLSKKYKAGVGVKIIHSHLSEFGAGAELGDGITTAIALDLGLIYQAHPRLDFGLAITNLGPDVQYSDNSQHDPLPRNASCGLAWKMLQGDFLNMLLTFEANKQLVALGDPREQEFNEITWSGGVEADYMDIIALRAGYFYEHEDAGKRQFFTIGFGVTPVSQLKFDFAYIPGDAEVNILANTLRMSLTYRP